MELPLFCSGENSFKNNSSIHILIRIATTILLPHMPSIPQKIYKKIRQQFFPPIFCWQTHVQTRGQTRTAGHCWPIGGQVKHGRVNVGLQSLGSGPPVTACRDESADYKSLWQDEVESRSQLGLQVCNGALAVVISCLLLLFRVFFSITPS